MKILSQAAPPLWRFSRSQYVSVSQVSGPYVLMWCWPSASEPQDAQDTLCAGRSSQFGLMRVRGRLQGMRNVWACTWTYSSIFSPIPFLSLLLAMNFCGSLQPIHFFFKQELVADCLSLLAPQVLTLMIITNMVRWTNFVINLCKVFYEQRCNCTHLCCIYLSLEWREGLE